MRTSKKNEVVENLGLGSTAEREITSRLLNRDGFFNVSKIGLTFWNALDIYNMLILMSWARFYPLLVGTFVGTNFIFAIVFVLLGRNAINGSKATSQIEYLGDAFFMCVQTFATIGYGVLSPNGTVANLMSVVVAFSGIVMSALATGLLFARFSRPTAKIMFSHQALIAPFRDGKAFMFRVSNLRRSQLLDVQARILLAKMEGEGDNRTRRYHQLSIEYDKITFMPQHWTIVHEITDKSPLWNMTEADFKADNCEVIVLLIATDDIFSQSVHARYSYYTDEVIWNARFVSMFTDPLDGKTTIDLRRLHLWDKVQSQ